MQVKRFFRCLYKRFLDDDVTDTSAMMAYYTVMALFPMLFFVLTLALVVIPRDTIQQGIVMATQAMPGGVRDVLSRRADQLINAAGAGFAVLGAIVAWWSASRGAVSLMTALDRMFHKKETRGYFKRQLIAVALTLAVAILVLAALGLLFVGPMVGHWIAGHIGMSDHAFAVLWGLVRWIGAGILVMLVWALLYKFLPDTDAPFRIFTPGAITGVLLWLGISALFGVYLGHFNSYEKTYGTLGGAIIFLVWLWLSNMALLFGAEVNDVLADLRSDTSEAAARLADKHEDKHRDREPDRQVDHQAPAHA